MHLIDLWQLMKFLQRPIANYRELRMDFGCRQAPETLTDLQNPEHFLEVLGHCYDLTQAESSISDLVSLPFWISKYSAANGWNDSNI